MKRIIALILSSMTLLMAFSYLIIPSKSYAITFSDVNSSHWAYNYITTLAEQGVINGYEDGTFKPSGTLTYAEFIKLMVCSVLTDDELAPIYAKIPEASEWYLPYFSWAKENHMLYYGFKAHLLKTPIERKYVARLLFNYVNYVKNKYSNSFEDFDSNPYMIDEKSKIFNTKSGDSYIITNDSKFDIKKYILDNDLPKDKTYKIMSVEDFIDRISKSGDVVDQLNYTDLDKVDDEIKEAVLYCSKRKLLMGYEDGSFKPDNTLTRAEAATIIYRFTNKFDNKILLEEK